MAQELAVIEKSLTSMSTQLQEAVPVGANLPAERIIRTILISCEMNPKLMECNRQTLVNAAWSAAVLGLEVDGITGQAYLIPYKGRVQLQIGFKGFGTLAARSGFMLNGGVIRDGDDYDVQLGTGGFIKVRPKLGKRPERKIIAAWASLEAHEYPTICDLMDLDEIEKARKVSHAKSGPWFDWFDQMAIKTAKKRLAKSAPLGLMHLASALDDVTARDGRTGYLRDDKALVIEGKGDPVLPDESQEVVDLTPAKWRYITSAKTEEVFGSAKQWQATIASAINQVTDEVRLSQFLERNEAVFNDLKKHDAKMVEAVENMILDRIVTLKGE